MTKNNYIESLIALGAVATLTSACSLENTKARNIVPSHECDTNTHWQVESIDSNNLKEKFCVPQNGWDHSFIKKFRKDVVSAKATTELPANTPEVSGFFKNGDGSAYAEVCSKLELTKADGAWRNYAVNNIRPVQVTIGTKFDQTHKWGESEIGGNFKPKNMTKSN
jgi:hypothetical protein